MTITLRALFDVNTERIRTSADAWTAMAESLDDATEDLIRGTQDLEYAWPDGPAAQSARAKTRETRNEASNAVLPCRTIGRALREFADGVEALQNTLKDITAEAVKAGYQVDIGAGTVSAPQHMYERTSAPHIVAQAINAYMHQLQGLVDRAAGIDARATSTIKANLPDAQSGFGSLSAPTIPLTQVEAMKGRDPADVNQWWNGLTSEQQDQILRDYPHLIGNIDGVPADDRDTANRSWLGQKRGATQAQLDYIYGQLSQLDPYGEEAIALKSRLFDLENEKRNLDAVQSGLDKAGPRGMLLGVDPAGDGKAIISVGNPDTADHVGVWVPGLGTTVAGSTNGNIERMVWLDEATKDHLQSGETAATVYWLGYDAPEATNLSVAGDGRARDGAGPYVNFMDGVHATHQGDVHLTAMGHSYGTTVIGEAAKSGDLRVDDIVTAGSPGMHVDHARDLNIDPAHVWSGSASNDPVSEPSTITRWTDRLSPAAWLAGEAYENAHGVSPHEAEFGANEYSVDTSGHSDYWQPESESLRNQAAILTGDYGGVGLEHGERPVN